MLEVGTKAPDFKLKDENGKERSLKEFKGQKIVLYFYPKDMTSGCTKQACNFASMYPQFQEKGAVVIGVSKDSVESHRKFKEKYNLPFILLSDESLDVIKKYDVWKKKSMYGREYMSTERSTYLIDEKGKIVKAFSKVKPADNSEQMLKELNNE